MDGKPEKSNVPLSMTDRLAEPEKTNPNIATMSGVYALAGTINDRLHNRDSQDWPVNFVNGISQSGVEFLSRVPVGLTNGSDQVSLDGAVGNLNPWLKEKGLTVALIGEKDLSVDWGKLSYSGTTEGYYFQGEKLSPQDMMDLSKKTVDGLGELSDNTIATYGDCPETIVLGLAAMTQALVAVEMGRISKGEDLLGKDQISSLLGPVLEKVGIKFV